MRHLQQCMHVYNWDTSHIFGAELYLASCTEAVRQDCAYSCLLRTAAVRTFAKCIQADILSSHHDNDMTVAKSCPYLLYWGVTKQSRESEQVKV